jgi:hypothetical protein
MPPCNIGQAACATVASHDISKPVIISDSYQLHLEDASSICANPTIELIKAATERISGDKHVGALLSIGGKFSRTRNSTDTRSYEAIEASAKSVHSHLWEHLSSSNIYFRFVVPYKSFLGSQDETLRNNILHYMDEGAVDELVHKLVTSSILGKIGRPLSTLCKYLKYCPFSYSHKI